MFSLIPLQLQVTYVNNPKAGVVVEGYHYQQPCKQYDQTTGGEYGEV
jgi:hypothetical protein